VSQARADKQRKHRSAQIVAALYSIFFVSIIASGYYLLFQKEFGVIAVPIAILLAGFAWSLARFIGGEPDGIKGHKAFFAMLLIISAVGVFNSLMLNLEGRRIFAETIDGSIDRFTGAESAAAKTLTQRGVIRHLDHVRELKSALNSEIRNPLNCGQGPEARRIIAELQAELPGFKPLSAIGVDCSKNDEVVADYDSRINELIEGAPWNDPVLALVYKDAGSAKQELQKLATASQTMLAPGLLAKVAPQLQSMDVIYRANREKLARQGVEVSSLAPQLSLNEVNSLGEWSQLFNLIIDRIFKISTWLYLGLAIFFDWMMVKFFMVARQSRPNRGSAASNNFLQKAW
jgi:hypothetical protein